MSEKMKNCKACNAEIASSAKTCPNCGAKNKKPIYKRPWIYILAVFILIIVLAVSGGGDTPVVIDYSNPEIVVAADDIMKEYSANSVTANEKYENKVIEISGRVSYISEYGFNISGDDDDNFLTSIDVVLASGQEGMLKRLKNGGTVSVIGVCDSTDAFGDIKLINAKLVEEKSELLEAVAETQSVSASSDGQTTERETVEVDIDQIIKEYDENPVAANEKYNGKKLIITGGKISSVEEKYVVVEGTDVWADVVYAYYTSKDEITSLKKDQYITVSGICRGDELFGVKITEATFE